MKNVRSIVWGASLVAVIGSVVAWAATGARVLTRYPSEGIAEQQSEESGVFEDLFEGAGLHDDHGELERIDNAFRFGLMPSGAGRESVSVASVCGLAGAALAGVWWVGRRRAGGGSVRG